MTLDRARKLQSVARWHRRLAVFVLLWLVLLAASGFVINHADDWGLDRKPLNATLLSWFYGIEAERDSHCEGIAIPAVDCQRVFARLALQLGSLLLSESSLWLLDDSGELLEQLPVAMTGLATIDSGLLHEGGIYLAGAGAIVRTGPELLEFEPLTSEEAEVLDGANWQDGNRVSGISWERFLLDLHAARFLGPFTKAFNDLMAFLILVLAVTGASLSWFKRKTNDTRRD